MADNWVAAELLAKAEVPTDVLMHIKTTVGEEMFDSFRMYYGDDPSRYNLNFEAIFGTYCNRMEWVTFLGTALAIGAHVVRFDDLNKMTTGKVLFYIQVPRVATGTGVSASRQTTIMVTKQTEKTPITIPFELSSACLSHLKDTFGDTLLDRLLNVDALNTVLRAVKNTADAMERGLVHSFLLTLMRKSPPQFIVQTLLENANITRTHTNRVQRANMIQSFKSKMVSSIFLLDRARDREVVRKFLAAMVESATDGILQNPDSYVTSSGGAVSGVLVSTPAVVQTLTSLLRPYVVQETVRAPAAYGEFVLSRENAVTAIAHHAILADFPTYAEKINAPPAQNGVAAGIPPDRAFAGATSAPAFANLPVDVLRLGERTIAVQHMQRVYKNTDTADPLERDVELTFHFPLGIYVPGDRGYTTVDNRIKLADTMANNLPTCAFFHNKDGLLQKLEFADVLRTACHPLMHDAAPSFQIFAERGPPEDEDDVRRLCRCEFRRERMGDAARRCAHFYQRRRESPRTTNEQKQDHSGADFFRTGNATLYTELHPMYDFTHFTNGAAIEPLCTPRIMVGNLPDGAAPAGFHECRAQQIAEHSRLKPPQGCDEALRVLHASLCDPQYPELFLLLDVMCHGHRAAMEAARPLIARCVNNYHHQRGLLAFCTSYDMMEFVATELNDGSVSPAACAQYRSVLATVRFVYRTSALTGLNGRLADEPLVAYANALYDERLLPPFLNHLPRNEEERVAIVADREPLGAAGAELRNHGISDVPRMAAMDDAEPLFVEHERLSDEDLAMRKIYYLCVVPALTNNRACGLGFNLKNLLVDVFYQRPFTGTDQEYADAHEVDERLTQVLRGVATDGETAVADAARELFAVLPYIAEHARVLEARAVLDPAQRHGAADFQSVQFVLYNGCCATTAPRVFREYATAIPFHRFYSDPNVCAGVSDDVQRFLMEFPHYNRNDGGFPLPPAFAHEYHSWHRSPFSKYSANCAQTSLLSILTLAGMHSKLSPVSMALHSKLRIHPGLAFTMVRTDVFETDTLLYTGKACTALVLNRPVVTKEERDINTTYHVTQNINTIDMGLGYSSSTCTAHLRRVRTDMGNRVQDLYQVFPMHVHRDDEVDAWLRHFTGAERARILDTEAMSMLAFGGVAERHVPALAHGQGAPCEAIPTPVTAGLEYFRAPNNPRGRSSCMISVDPHDAEAATKVLYDHAEPDPQTLLATNNPWASQQGSVGDVLYNARNRHRLGYNSTIYSPCAQFFNTDDILAANKTLMRATDDYLMRAKDCIRGDSDTQYICVEGTDGLVERPCRFLQEAYPMLMSTTPALLESRQKGPPGTGETHFGNYSIGETIPLHTSILFNS